MSEERSIAERVVAALAAAGGPLTADEVCRRVFGRPGARQRNTVAVTLYRLVEAKRAKKREATWTLADDVANSGEAPRRR